MAGWGNGRNSVREPDLTVTITKNGNSARATHGMSAIADLDAPLWRAGGGARPPERAHEAAPPSERPTGPPARRQEEKASPRRHERPAHPDRLLRPEDYLTEPVQPPTMGWRRVAWHWGMHRLQPGARELRHRDWARHIRRSLRSPKVIAVFSPKGGVGKSTTTLQLGDVLATLRGDLIAGLDANPDSGNLVKRVREPYSVFTAGELHRDRQNVVRYADLMPYLTQGDSGLCVVRSDPSAAARLGPQEYQEILELLARFYSVVVIDLGTGMREPAFLSIVDVADALVAVSRPSFDAAEVLAEGMDWLAGRFPEKIAAATMVLNAVAPGANQLDADRLAEELGDWVGRVLRIPYDRHLATGGVPQWSLLAKPTQDAYLELAASVIASLPNERSRSSRDRGDASARGERRLRSASGM